MSNMSYCRFRNTLNDLSDCANNFHEDDLSSDEHNAQSQASPISHVSTNHKGLKMKIVISSENEKQVRKPLAEVYSVSAINQVAESALSFGYKKIVIEIFSNDENAVPPFEGETIPA